MEDIISAIVSYFEMVMLDMIVSCTVEYLFHYIQFLHFGPGLE